MRASTATESSVVSVCAGKKVNFLTQQESSWQLGIKFHGKTWPLVLSPICGNFQDSAKY